MRRRLKDGSAAPALLNEAGDADMIVAGSHEPDAMPVGSTASMVVDARGTGVVETPTLGATSDALLKHAPCTVAVVPSRNR